MLRLLYDLAETLIEAIPGSSSKNIKELTSVMNRLEDSHIEKHLKDGSVYHATYTTCISPGGSVHLYHNILHKYIRLLNFLCVIDRGTLEYKLVINPDFSDITSKMHGFNLNRTRVEHLDFKSTNSILVCDQIDGGKQVQHITILKSCHQYFVANGFGVTPLAEFYDSDSRPCYSLYNPHDHPVSATLSWIWVEL